MSEATKACKDGVTNSTYPYNDVGHPVHIIYNRGYEKLVEIRGSMAIYRMSFFEEIDKQINLVTSVINRHLIAESPGVLKS